MKRTLRDIKEKLEKIAQKAPRAGVHPTKVFKDKSKYNRKEKHKKEWPTSD